jgi:hypothetical protein
MLSRSPDLMLYCMALACCYCSSILSTSLPARQRSSQARTKVLGLKGGECSGKTLNEIVSISDVVLIRNGEGDTFSNRLIDILESKVEPLAHKEN